MGNVFFHSGDIGDVIAALPAMRQLGGGALIIGPHNGPGAPREPMTQDRFDFFFPLVLAQNYISTVKFGPKTKTVTHDFSSFRVRTRGIQGESLSHWHARHVGIENLDVSPWLWAAPDERANDRVCCARSPRYHNPKFPWSSLLPKSAFFVGLTSEREALSQVIGRSLDYFVLKDMMEMARLIAGSRLFIGNQSAPCWIAMGLGHPLIQETFNAAPNSIIARENARFMR